MVREVFIIYLEEEATTFFNKIHDAIPVYRDTLQPITRVHSILIELCNILICVRFFPRKRKVFIILMLGESKLKIVDQLLNEV